MGAIIIPHQDTMTGSIVTMGITNDMMIMEGNGIAWIMPLDSSGMMQLNVSIIMVIERLNSTDMPTFNIIDGCIIVGDRIFDSLRGSIYGKHISIMTARTSSEDGHWTLSLTGSPMQKGKFVYSGGLMKQCGTNEYMIFIKTTLYAA